MNKICPKCLKRYTTHRGLKRCPECLVKFLNVVEDELHKIGEHGAVFGLERKGKEIVQVCLECGELVEEKK